MIRAKLHSSPCRDKVRFVQLLIRMVQLCCSCPSLQVQLTTLIAGTTNIATLTVLVVGVCYQAPHWFFASQECISWCRMLLFIDGKQLCAAGDDLCAAGDDLCAAGDDLCAAGDDLCAAGDDLCAAGDDLCVAGDDLCVAGDDLCAAGDGLCAAGDAMQWCWRSVWWAWRWYSVAPGW